MFNCPKLKIKDLFFFIPLRQQRAVRVHLIDSLIAWGYQGGDFAPLDSLGLPECILFAL